MAQSRSDITKKALIDTAFQLFAVKGFAATSTREIATTAKTNIASITYHFGSKAGLRMACAQTIVDRFSKIRTNPEALDVPDIIKSAETSFEAMILRQAYVFLQLEEAEAMISFLFREAHEKGEVFDHIYENFFRTMFEFLLSHWADSIGISAQEAQSEANRLLVFSMIGQVAYFRVGQPVVAKHMKWQGYSETEALAVLTILQSNIRTIINAHRNAS
ncbi:CerR family C-terminal domain-containing protein [Cohaesibacter celericrescens]|uniref:HTH tetR-type domain-containing protein n=1 Tax=Cohaesibacter celericrescens TaxID=2067669 RepID=A0A2N5XX01_9HYPH|nr:CerR family C-terminal domain-containing protein [Cohaesibacter celericrescens]PLW79031.1 hypothetical protein C0081_02015 [Cohaesibacter celericrescens]